MAEWLARQASQLGGPGWQRECLDNPVEMERKICAAFEGPRACAAVIQVLASTHALQCSAQARHGAWVCLAGNMLECVLLGICLGVSCWEHA